MSVFEWIRTSAVFYVVNVCEVLTDTTDSTTYWRKLKQRFKSVGNETVTVCHGMKLVVKGRKLRVTDGANIE